MKEIIENNDIQSDKNENSIDIDRIKILEVANKIDEWENDVLFSQNGFYSLLGKSVIGKTEELIEKFDSELENQICEIEFNSSNSRSVAQKIKAQKLDTIKTKMLEYEENQKQQYAFEVIDNALKLIKNKAISYKFYPDIVNKSYFNALSVLSLLGNLKNWDKKELNNQIKSFNSEFFEDLVWGYIEERSKFAVEFFNRNKDFIEKSHHEEIEKALSDLENKLSAFDFAKELFDNNVPEKEGLKSVSEIKDENVKDFAKIYFNCFNSARKNLLKAEKEELTQKAWQNIDVKLKENSDLAMFEVNLHQDKSTIDSQISYIKQMTTLGKIATDDKKFFELYQFVFENSDEFFEKNIYDYKSCLSDEDFKYFQSLKELKNKDEFWILQNDYIELSQHFSKDMSKNVLLIKSKNAQISEYEKNNKKSPLGKDRSEIIEKLSNNIITKAKK